MYKFVFDKRISSFTRVMVYFQYIISVCRGFMKFWKFGVYLGRNTKIMNKRNISYKIPLKISDGVRLNPLSENGIKLGRYCSIGFNTRIECTGSLSFLGKGFQCGDNCGLGADCFFGSAGGIQIGNDVIFGNFVSLHSENHTFNQIDIPIRLQGVTRKGIVIGNNCWIGAKVTILDGAKIGNNSVIAAGAVVKGEFPDNVVIGGVPAKIIKYTK